MDKPKTPDMSLMQAKPQKEHQWLEKLAGDWTYEGNAMMDPNEPPMKFTGTENIRSLGGLWYIAEAQGDMPDGSTATMIMTLGYDPQEKHYVGTWIGSMMTHLWHYKGALDATGKTLILDSVGPNMATPGTLAKFKDSIEFRSNDLRVLTSTILDENGRWREVMRAEYRRSRAQ
jgi:hypothetical protein